MKTLGEKYILNITLMIEFCSRNFLQVKVFFERLNFQEVREELSYKVTLEFSVFAA